MSLSPSELFFAGQPSGGGGGGYQISRSLRFDSLSASYLNRTPAASGNKKTWTWSGWIKRCNLWNSGGTNTLLQVESPSYHRLFVLLDKIYIDYQSAYSLSTTGVFRDTAAWYHIVVAFDTTQATDTNRIKFYVNGVLQQVSGTYPTLNFDNGINGNVAHYISYSPSSSLYTDQYFTELRFIDGQALTADSFGEINATTGVWSPKAYSGSYGTNGWYLNFSNNASTAALGTDYSGNSNTWTVNNASVSPTSYAVSFDGANDEITVADNVNLRPETSDFTIEFWIRFKSLTGYQTVLTKGYTSAGGLLLQTTNNTGTLVVYLNSATLFTASSGTPVNTWNHYALVRSGNTITLYRDGTSVGSGSFSANLNDNNTLEIGGSPGGGGYWVNGYISNFRFVKGTAVYTSTFTPPTSPLTAIAGTQLLTCQSQTFVDNSPNAFTVTPVNQATTTVFNPFGDASANDSFVDSPTNYGTDTSGAGGLVRGNYCTWSPVASNSSAVISNGNLDNDNASTYATVKGTFALATGKWYWEYTLLSAPVGGAIEPIGLADINMSATAGYVGLTNNNSAGVSLNYLSNLNIYVNSSVVFTTTGCSIYDVIGVAYDADSKKLWFSRNGTWLGPSSPNPATGTSPISTALTGTQVPACTLYDTKIAANFGQSPFAYNAPSGFKELCTQNLTPTITKPNTVMDVLTWTGTSANQTVSGLNFNPDLIWIKIRSAAKNHVLQDIVRGFTTLSKLSTSGDFAEGDPTNLPDWAGYVNGSTSTGFTLTKNGTGAEDWVQTNRTGDTYVGWCWDAGSTTVTNTDGTASAQVRANVSAGFSIVTAAYLAGTVGHGLGVAPAMVIAKQRDFANSWYVYHKNSIATGTVANNSYLAMNSTIATANAGVNLWNVTSTTVGSNQGLTNTGVYYCFAAVAGYSDFGTYTGNGSADGPMVFTNMRPRWIMLKRTDSASNWTIIDTSREGYNIDNDPLYPNTAGVEGTTDLADILSNGFKLRSTDASVNASAGTYIYACFAESPFALARAR